MKSAVAVLVLVLVVDKSATAPVAGSYLADAPPHVPRIGRRSEAPQVGRTPLTHAETVYYLLPRHYPRVGRSGPSVTSSSSRPAQYRNEDLLSLLKLGDAFYSPDIPRRPTTEQLYRAPLENAEGNNDGGSELDDMYDERPLLDEPAKSYGQDTSLYERAVFQDDDDRDEVDVPMGGEASPELGDSLLSCDGVECAVPRGLLKALVRSLLQRAAHNARLQHKLHQGSRLQERQFRRLW